MNESIEQLPNIMVFDVDNVTFDLIGVLERYESVQVTFNSSECGDLQIDAPIIDANVELLREGHVVWFGERRAAIITQVRKERVKDGGMMIIAKGKTIVWFLSWRCIPNDLVLDDMTVWNAAVKIFQDNFPASGVRQMPWLDRTVYSNEYEEHDVAHTTQITTEASVTDVYEALSEMATTYDLTFELRMYPKESPPLKLYFSSGVDRTIGNPQGINPVVLSADTQDLLDGAYEYSDFDFVNYAYVKGEENDDGNIRTSWGDGQVAGWERRELFVDASGVSSTTEGDDGDPHTVTEEEYVVMLQEEAKAQINEREKIETYEATLNQVGDHRYKLDEDFFLGDKITIIDTDLGVQLDARLTSVEYVYGKGKTEQTLHFGYDNMRRLGDVIKRRW